MNAGRPLRRALPVVAALFALAAVLAACAGPATPADPVWGREPCAHCVMLVGDRRYAAQAIDEHGERRFFDDVGCLAAWSTTRGLPAAAWVRDETDAWVDARAARYGDGFKTPMDSGFAAARTGTSSWDDVARAVADGRDRR